MSSALRTFTLSLTLSLVLVLASGSPAFAKDLIVDGKNPAAKDANPGTLEAPLATIQAGLNVAKPGDTVLVRAGVYHEIVTFPNSGTSNGAAWDELQNAQWITLEAYKDERAIVDGSLTIPAKDWTLVAGRANTYVASVEPKGGPEPWRKTVTMLFADDVMVMPTLVEHHDPTHPGLPLVPAIPGDKTSDQGWYYDPDQKKVFVNLGGRTPGKDVQVAAAEMDMGVCAMERSYVRLRKMEIRRFNFRGIWSDRSNEFLAEDNYVHHCGTGVWGGSTSGQIIRGNIISDIMTIAMYVHTSRGMTIENNVIKHFHVNPFKTEGSLSADYYSGSIMCNSMFGLLIRNNIIAQSIGNVSGPWPDCGSTGITIYGNTIYGLKGDGFYIEDAVHGTVLKWNTVFENGNGIVFRQNFANTAFENYVFNNRGVGLVIGSCEAGVRADGMMYNWVIGNGVGVSFGPDKTGEPAHAFDHNIYSGNGLLFQFGDKQYKDMKSVRDVIGQEFHGQEVKDFDPAPLGLVTFRVDGTRDSWKPVPMFGNPVAIRADVQSPYDQQYFWKKGTFLKPEPYGWHSEGFGGIGGFALAQATGFVRVLPAWIIPFCAARADAKVDKGGADDPSAIWKNTVCLQVCTAPGKTVSAEGLGYWSVRLPTTDDAQIDLSLWIRAKGVKPAGEHGGVYAMAEFCDATGQNTQRQYLPGANDGLKHVGAEFIDTAYGYQSGTYEYKKVSGMVTAPKGARWFRMGFGIRNCTGWAAFNNFDINTRSGEKPQEVKVAPPIDVTRCKWAPCDLKGLLNRPLADDVEGDGKGGWTDQGPTMDLRNLYAGSYTYNDVPFRVEKGNACFIMKNKKRPSENLPDGGKVDLKGKADMLAFLHTGGWIDVSVRQATYIVQYADGTQVEIPLIGGKNIFDWTASPTVLEGQKYDPELGFTQFAVKVPVPRFVSAYVWMTVWKNPHPEKEMTAFEVKGANEGIPGLIAVSAGVAK